MYTIEYQKSVDKELRSLSIKIRKQVVIKILALAEDPRPKGATKIRGSDSLFRIRHADYRIVYRIKDNTLVVLILKVGHRREVYRDL